MHPILISLGPFTIHTYGVFIAAAFLAAMGWAMREAKWRGLDHTLVPELGFRILIGAIVGSRLLYVLIKLPYYVDHPGEILMFWRGGLVFSGGAILAALLGWNFLRRRSQPLMPWLDAAAPGIALGQAVGRLGCLMAGCCYGALTDVPWAITFTEPLCLAPQGVPLHPTQLYHSLAGLAAFFILIGLKRRVTKPGALMGLFLILFAAFRWLIEFFRADYRGYAGPFSVTQFIALGFLALGLYLMLRPIKENKRP